MDARRIACSLALCLAALAIGAPAASASSAIARENARPGDSGWDVTVPAQPSIEGYASEASAMSGRSFHLHVGAPANSRYRIDVYRLGWYGGAGGRLVTCQPSCDGDEPATAQPAAPAPDPASGRVDAGWRTTDVVRTGPNWVSGYYLAVLRVTAGPQTGAVGRVPLVVRPRTSVKSKILVQVPVNTWQAYNPWGGRRLYPIGATPAGTKVSFNRPYGEDVAVPVPNALELQLVRFLEREGYDVAYQADVDTDRDPGSLRHHRLVMTAGHSEYWSGRMRNAFDTALARGTNLAFMGGNTAYWQARYENGRRTLVVYRSRGADPVRNRSRQALAFRSLRPRRPECRLLGVQYQLYAQRPASAAPTPYTVAAAASDPWLRGTGLAFGDILPGLVGYEWDAIQPGCTAGRVTDLLHADAEGVDGRAHPADAVRVVARSGARVFSSGSIQFSWALDAYGGHTPDPRVQQLVRNVIADLSRAHKRPAAAR